MNRNKRIIDCTPNEIFNLGRQLIDYYFEKREYMKNPLSAVGKLVKQYRVDLEEGEMICQDQNEL
jgi:hypothetical protein